MMEACTQGRKASRWTPRYWTRATGAFLVTLHQDQSLLRPTGCEFHKLGTLSDSPFCLLSLLHVAQGRLAAAMNC